MKILVTGGAGFIGAPLVKRLVKEGHKVMVIDDLSRGSIENLDGYLDKIQFHAHDMKEPWAFLQSFDVVFDLAARVYGITKLYEDQPGFLRENTLILLNTLECLKGKVKHYFYVSSSCVYNYPGCPIPHKEEDATMVPETGYDISKRFAEEIVKLYAKKHHFHYTIVRPFNVYGPGESGEGAHVVTDFKERLILELTKRSHFFSILGSGEQTRSFTYIKDFVDALVFLMGDQQSRNEVFNVGTGLETKIIDVLKLMFKIADLNYDDYVILHRKPIKGDVQRRCPDVSLLFNMGWHPRYTLEEGLRETWEAGTE